MTTSTSAAKPKRTRTSSKKPKKRSASEMEVSSETETRVLKDVVVYLTQNITIGRKLEAGTPGVFFVAYTKDNGVLVSYRNKLWLAKENVKHCFDLG